MNDQTTRKRTAVPGSISEGRETSALKNDGTRLESSKKAKTFTNDTNGSRTIDGANPMKSIPGEIQGTARRTRQKIKEWWKRACLACFNCKKEKCKECFLCRSDQNDDEWSKQRCFQKMCLEIPEADKFEKAPGFPEGWKFGFIEQARNDQLTAQKWNGLVLVSPAGRRIRALDRAISRLHMNSVDSELFCKYVGFQGVMQQLPYAGNDLNKYSQLSDPDVLAALGSGPLDCFSLVELFQLRCKTCPSCIRKDCGKCLPCRNNKMSTSRNREVCYFKMCETISIAEKAQPVPGLHKGWVFYIVPVKNPSDYARRISRLFHPDLVGLHIISSDRKRVYRSIEDAVRDCHFSGEAASEKNLFFLETLLGVKARRERSSHDLIGFGFHREWTDGRGRHREICGEIIKCWEPCFRDDDEDELCFTVKYDREYRDFLDATSMCQFKVPLFDDNVPEHIAWGGYLSFIKDHKKTAHDQLVAKKAPFHFSWVVPTTRYKQRSETSQFKSLVLLTRGFKLELEARESSIPNAGFGLWVKCTEASNVIGRNTRYFELEPGEAVDLGVYAPVDSKDRRPEHVNLLKAFVHKWDNESWCFEMTYHHRGNYVYDITDDITGELHEKARENIVVYANETDGKEKPSIFAEHDPEGSVHYYMGHREEVHGAFRLPANGQSIELKVDYGSKYEDVRVRKGYTRLPKEEAKKVQDKLNEDDEETIRDIKEFSAKDLFDIISFLERILKKKESIQRDKLARALLVALALKKRVISILNEFKGFELSSDINDETTYCNNGYTEMKSRNTLSRVQNVVSEILRSDQLRNALDLRVALTSDTLYVSILRNAIGTEAFSDINSLDAKELQDRLLDLAVSSS